MTASNPEVHRRGALDTMARSDDEITSFTSPPCFLHEMDSAYSGLARSTGPNDWITVMRWRKAERAHLIEERLAIPRDVRWQKDAQIAANLKAATGDVAGRIVSAYWPIRGDPDLRQLFEHLVACGARMALPVVVAPSKPLAFRTWTPGAPLERGVWGIPTPPAGAEAVVPEILIVPVVGFDPACHRLGYGGGFFDRTLAAMPNRRRVVGVGYGQAALATIYPQPHDIPMSIVVTEGGAIRNGA